jgi:hypothetical protein
VQGGNAFGAAANLGTTDNQPVQIVAKGLASRRLVPNVHSPSLVAGHPGNAVTAGVSAATVAGGGSTFSSVPLPNDAGAGIIYKADADPSGRRLQYGLIAEEVAAVYPGLVAHSPDGQVETEMYQFLPPMPLKELQKQQRTIEAQATGIASLKAQAGRLAAVESERAAIRQALGVR